MAYYFLALAAWALPYFVYWHSIGSGDYDVTVAWAQIATWWHQRGNYSAAWEPFFCGGRPLFGHPQIPLLHPAVPLFLVFGPVVGFKVAILLSLSAGFFLFVKLMESYGFSKHFSQVMGAVWVLNGFFIGHLGWMHFHYISFFFVPAFLLYIRSWVREQRLRYLLLLILLTVLASVESYSFLVYFFLTLPFYFLLELWVEKPAFRKSLLIMAGFALVLIFSMALLSPYLIPVSTYMKVFPRHVSASLNNPLKMITFLFFPGAMFRGSAMSHEYQIFVGPVLFYFLVIALSKIRQLPKSYIPLVGYGAFHAILALGSFHELATWLYSPFDLLRAFVPGYSQIKIPSRFLIGAIPGILLLIAWQWQNRGVTPRSKFFVFVFLVGFCLSNGFQMNQASVKGLPKPRPEVGNDFSWEGKSRAQYSSIGSTTGLTECYDPTPFPARAGTIFKGNILTFLPAHLRWERQEWGRFSFFSTTASDLPSELQLNVAFHPGWTITTLRGGAPSFLSGPGDKIRVLVPAGTSDFVLEFKDPSVVLGWKVFCAAAGLLLVCFMILSRVFVF